MLLILYSLDSFARELCRAIEELDQKVLPARRSGLEHGVCSTGELGVLRAHRFMSILPLGDNFIYLLLHLHKPLLTTDTIDNFDTTNLSIFHII